MSTFSFVDPATWPRRTKKTLVLLVDAALIPVTLYVAFALRLGSFLPHQQAPLSPLLFLMVTLLGVGLLLALKVHRLKLHSFDIHSMVRIAVFSAGLTLIATATSQVLGLWAPRSVPLIFGAVFFLIALLVRMAGLAGLYYMRSVVEKSIPVAIYGAGAAGMQLATALRQSSELRPVAFVDDNSSLHGIIIGGIKVQSPKRLSSLVDRGRIERVLIAIPSMTLQQRNELMRRLKDLACEVQAIPSYVDLISGKNIVSDLRSISPDALLARDKVDLDIPEVAKAYAGRSILVTGAGGSIGSELCRQLIECRPRQIVLFERSEYALYEVERILRPQAEKAGIALTARLGSVGDRIEVESALSEFNVEIVLHAAAHKHVPLIEVNEFDGARNNILGTRIVAEAAERAGVERFILVSTDKAVRPANIMGATKRLAEIVTQDVQTRSASTRYAMVRFGNVLGSSGSVVPLFRQQIEKGGPVTVTHPDVTRYFMTIPEAARLVLLAGAYAEGGDLFVLDMSEPVAILDLARRMIALAGRTVRDAANPNGDIEIVFTGLRPGEKLYEELLIDDENLVSTPHQKIMRAHEPGLSQIEVAAMLKQVETALTNRDKGAIRALIERYVDGYAPEQQRAEGS